MERFIVENKKANKQKINDKQDDTMWIIYENAREKNMQSLDKVVVAISSALFGLLLAIDSKTLLDKSQISLMLFKVLIASNAVTIIFVLISYYTANKSIDIQQQDAKNNDKTDCWECATKFLNFGYLLATCITIITLAIIMWQIFSVKENIMDNKQSSDSNQKLQIEHEGYIPNNKNRLQNNQPNPSSANDKPTTNPPTKNSTKDK